MDFLSLAKMRCSVRSYTDKPVEDEKIAAILEAGRVAPTGKNNQPHRLLVVKSKEGLEKLAKSTLTANAYTATAAIVVCAEHDAAWVRSIDGHNIYEIDATIVTTHMILEATEQGLGSLWVCRFDPEILKTEFNIPDAFVPVNILFLGYAEPSAIKSDERFDEMRKPLCETVWYESF